MSGHVAYVCPTYHEGTYCPICEGGLFSCAICNSFEGATTTDCPERKMTADEIDAVYKGDLDFQDGQWVNAPSRHCPSFYARTVEA